MLRRRKYRDSHVPGSDIVPGFQAGTKVDDRTLIVEKCRLLNRRECNGLDVRRGLGMDIVNGENFYRVGLVEQGR